MNDPQLFGKEISELAERIGDILIDAHGYTRAEILSRYAHSDAPPICVYIYDFTRSVLGYIYGHSSEALREAIVGKYRIPNPNDVFVYYEPALTVLLDDRAQYEALLARKDEVVRDVYTLMRGKFPLDKLEKTFGYPILTEESTVVKIILKSDMDPVLLNNIVGTR